MESSKTDRKSNVHLSLQSNINVQQNIQKVTNKFHTILTTQAPSSLSPAHPPSIPPPPAIPLSSSSPAPHPRAQFPSSPAPPAARRQALTESPPQEATTIHSQPASVAAPARTAKRIDHSVLQTRKTRGAMAAATKNGGLKKSHSRWKSPTSGGFRADYIFIAVATIAPLNDLFPVRSGCVVEGVVVERVLIADFWQDP